MKIEEIVTRLHKNFFGFDKFVLSSVQLWIVFSQWIFFGFEVLSVWIIENWRDCNKIANIFLDKFHPLKYRKWEDLNKITNSSLNISFGFDKSYHLSNNSSSIFFRLDKFHPSNYEKFVQINENREDRNKNFTNFFLFDKFHE